MGRLNRFIPWGLLGAGALVAVLVVWPFRSVSLVRSDGGSVRVPNLEHLTHTSDAWDYLQLGRQIQRGAGFTSLFTYPPFLPESVGALDDASPARAAGPVERFPLLWRQPGYPLLVAAAFSLAGKPEPNAVLVVQAAAIALLPLVTYLLARRLFTPGWAAWAGLFALLSPLAVSVRAPFTATTPYAGLLVLVAWALLRARSTPAWVGTGALLGVAVLLRLETWILVPGLLLLMARTHERGRTLAAALVVGTALVVVLPWHLHLVELTGHPFYNQGSLLYHGTEAFPGWESSRTLAVRTGSPAEFVAAHPGDVVRKTLLNGLRFARDLVLLPSPFLAPFLWLALWRPRTREGGGFLAGVIAATVGLAVVLAPMEYAPRFLAPLVPLLTVAAVFGLAQIPRFRAPLIAVGVATGVLLLVGSFSTRDRSGTARLAAEDLDRLMASPEGAPLRREVALADAPTVYAWIWERPAVWTPLPDDLPRVTRLLPGCIAVFTRAMGRGDGIDPGTVAAYVATGGIASGAEPPLLIRWDHAASSAAERRPR